MYIFNSNALPSGVLLDTIHPELKHKKPAKGFVQWIDGGSAFGIKLKDDARADALVKVIDSAKYVLYVLILLLF